MFQEYTHTMSELFENYTKNSKNQFKQFWSLLDVSTQAATKCSVTALESSRQMLEECSKQMHEIRKAENMSDLSRAQARATSGLVGEGMKQMNAFFQTWIECSEDWRQFGQQCEANKTSTTKK